MTITPNDHEKAEWARMAQAAYRTGRNAIGHRYSAAAALRHNEPLPLPRFDTLQSGYRAWLVFNEFPGDVS